MNIESYLPVLRNIYDYISSYSQNHDRHTERGISTTEAEPKQQETMPTADDLTADLNQRALAAMSEDDRLAAAASASQAAASANSLASTLRSKASLLTDPAERSRMMQEAYNKEIEAHGNSKRARYVAEGSSPIRCLRLFADFTLCSIEY